MIKIDGFPIDCAVSVEVVRESEVTSHPVEVGADVTDHVRNNPVLVNLDCRISNTPMDAVAALRTGIPSEEGRARLIAIRNAREPVTIELVDETLDSMVMQSFTTPQTVQTGEALEFRVTFKEVVLVTNQRATVPVLLPRSSKKKNAGNKPSDEKTDDKAKRRAGLLKNLVDGNGFTSSTGSEILGAF